MTGDLSIRILSASHLSHAPRVKFTETHVVIKIDGVVRGKTKAAKAVNGQIKWNEDFDIQVDRASEIEITLYDRLSGGVDNHLPIGLLWIKIYDIAEELRTKAKIAGGWAPASGILEGVQNLSVRPTSPGGDPSAPVSPAPSGPPTQGDGIEDVWDVEPVGQLGLKLNFGESRAARGNEQA